MSISVIIPCHKKNIQELYSLLNQLTVLKRVKNISFEIIVIFNGFKKEFPRLKDEKNYTIKYFKNPLIIGHARNIGASLSKCDYLVFIDADIKFFEDSILNIDRVINKLNVGKFQAVFPRIKQLSSKNVFALLDSKEDIRAYVYRVRDRTTTTLYGPFVIISKRNFDDLGGWEEKTLCAEDKDLAARIIIRGGKILYTPEIITIHNNYNTLKGIVKRKIFHAKCNALVYERYPSYFHRSFKEWMSIIASKYNSRYPMHSSIYVLVMVMYVLFFYVHRIRIRYFESNKIPFANV